MITMINNFFTMFAMIFSAGARFATSVDNLACIAEDESAGLVKVLSVERADRLAKLEASLSVKRPTLNAPASNSPITVE